jgi:ligand-binding sensor domain-containing protein
MKHFTLIIVALVQFFNIELYSQLQQQSPATNSYDAICSWTNFLPYNAPRGMYFNLIGQTKDQKMIFADQGSYNNGVSVYNGNNWEYWTKDNYLNSNNIWGFYNDTKGKTWISTDSGLNVYNGISWKKYPSSIFKENCMSLICEDKNKIIWAFSGCTPNISIVFDSINNEIKQITTPFDDLVTSATQDKDRNMWVATQNGVFKYDGSTWVKYTTKDGLNQNHVIQVKLINDTIYCLSGSSGDSIKKLDGPKFKTVISPAIQTGVGFRSIIEDSKHNIWILTQMGAVYKRTNQNWTQVPYWNIEIYNIRTIFADKDDNIWSTSAGPKVAKIADGNMELIDNTLDKGIGFSNPNKLFIDRSNNAWVSSLFDNGLSKYDGFNWSYYKNVSTNSSSSFTQDKNGNILVGGQYIAKFDGNNWTYLWDGPLSNYTYSSALMYDKNNNLWFVSDNKIMMFNGTDVTEYDEQDGVFPYAQKIIQDKEGNIWATYDNTNKVIKFNGSVWSSITMPVNNIGCQDATADSLGNVWFATLYGLVKYNNATGMKLINNLNSSIPFNAIMGIACDKENNLWFTSDYPMRIGLYNQSKDTYRQFSLSSYNYNSSGGRVEIAVDNNKNVYLGSYGTGLHKFSFSILMPEISSTNIDCVGADNGSLSIFPKKDLSFSYSINGSAFANDTIYTNLKSGDYTIIGKRGQCYTSPTQLTISQPTGKFDVEQKNVSCYGLLDGSIKISTEGLGDVDFKWSNGNNTNLINGIGMGNYTLQVKYGTCQFDRSFTISQPTPIKLSSTLINDCGTTGKISVTLDGGIKPYTINWLNGSSSLNLENLTAGNYTISVKDANNCNIKDSTFTIKTLNPIPRENIIGIPKAYICSDNLSISTKNDFVSYNWYKDNALLDNKTKSISATEAGTYKVGITDQNNCYAIDSIKVIKKRDYATPQICLVTVDVAANNNKIIWNKFPSDSSALINVLKETNQSGIYATIGKVNAYKSGIFTDVNSDPSVKADRYKINLTDECQVNSDSSTLHKTIHLTSNVGINGEVNLIWSDYGGFIFNSYNIYRGTSKDNLVLINTIQSSLNSYTDVNPPITEKYYQIEVVSPSECNPDALKAGIIGTRSNIINKLNTSIASSANTEELRIFPNPAENAINVYFANPNNDEFKVQLIDISGKILTQKITHSDYLVIERENLKSGIYFIELKSSSNSNRAKVILK